MNTQRKTLVLLHGHGMDDTIWGQLSVLLSEYYTVVHPNFSLFTFCRSLDDYADELHRLLTNAGIKTFTLVGHSMGGYIGLAFAQKYPEMLEGFVLFHSTAFADDDTKKHQRDQMIQLIRKHGAAAFVKHTAANLYGERYKELSPEAIQQHIEQFGGLPSEALAVGMEAMRDRPDRTAVLTEMSFPVLFLIGMRDQLVPFERSIELVGYAKHGFPFILAEAGHMAMIERPDAIFRILRWYMDTKIGQS